MVTTSNHEIVAIEPLHFYSFHRDFYSSESAGHYGLPDFTHISAFLGMCEQ